MLGRSVVDEEGCEGEPGSSVRGMGLLPVVTYFENEKNRCRIEGRICELTGGLSALSGKRVSGYELHMGRTVPADEGNTGCRDFAILDERMDGYCRDGIIGTYLHGIFDEDDFRGAFVHMLCDRAGIEYEPDRIISLEEYREQQYDKLADILRESLDIGSIYKMLGF